MITNQRELNADDFIRSAFVANSLRGMDSSGLATIDIDSMLYDYHKLPVAGTHFIGDRVADRLIKKASNQKTITMAHVRAATVGDINISNAHPFVYESKDGERTVIGTHNGTLQGWATHKDAKGFTVDSEWAINHIANEKFDAFEDFKGAYCFVWWDSDSPTTLNIARNPERPMYVAMLESGGMAYASEAGMLYWLLERHRVKIKGEILELQENYWYKFDVEDPTDFEKIKLPAPKAAVTNYPAPRPVTHTTRNSSMDKVKSLLDRVKGESDKKPVRHNNATPAEYEAARNLNLLGQTAHFEPIADWADGIEGVAYVENAQLSATVRGYDAAFTDAEMWQCPIIGVQDDGEELVLVLGAPTATLETQTVN